MHAQNDADDTLLLAEMLAIRLCHDLSGPLNALVGAVELLHEEPAVAEEAAGLASEAGDAMVRKLRLARAAWGGGGGGLEVEEVRCMLDGVFGRNLRLDLGGLARTVPFSPPAARLVLNVLLMAAESLPAGGVVAVSGSPGHDIVVRIQGPRAAWPAGLAGMLADPANARQRLRACEGVEAARALQAPLTALIVHASRMRMTFLLGPRVEEAPPLLVALTRPH